MKKRRTDGPDIIRKWHQQMAPGAVETLSLKGGRGVERWKRAGNLPLYRSYERHVSDGIIMKNERSKHFKIVFFLLAEKHSLYPKHTTKIHSGRLFLMKRYVEF